MDYELQSQLLINALKEAEGQRAVRMPEAKMQGNYAILPGAGNTLAAGFDRALGNFQKPRIEQQMTDLRGQERGEYDRLLKELTTPGMKQVQDNSSAMGPLPEPVTRSVPLAPLEESQRRMSVYGQMSRLPMAKAMADKGIASEVDFPEKQALREQQIAAANELARQRAEDQFRADRARAEDRNAQILMQQQGREDLARLAASLRPPAAPHQRQTVTTDQGVLEWNGKSWSPIMVDGNVAMKAPTGAAGSGKMSAQTEKALNSTKTLLDTVNMGLGMVDQSSGVYTAVPGAIRQHFTSPATKIADSTIGQLNAEKAHELYGAAFTAAEMSRAGTFLPENTDTIDTKKWKLGQMKILLEKKEARLTGQPDPYPNLHNDILDPLSRGEMPQARPSALPKANGAGTRQTTGAIGAVKQPSAEDVAAREWAAANPDDPRAAAIMQKLGGK